MAEHHTVLQAPLLEQLAKAQQRPQGFACPGAGVDQHILAAGLGLHQPGPQQLDQLALPLAWPHVGQRFIGTAIAGKPPALISGLISELISELKREGRWWAVHGGHCGARSPQMSDLAYGHWRGAA